MSELSIHTNIDERMAYAARLLRKAKRLNMTAAVLFDNEDLMDAFDKYLWEFDQNSFIPHAVAGSRGDAHGAFQLAFNAGALSGGALLIMMSKKVPANFLNLFNKFPKIIDMVPRAGDELTDGRNRYRTYKQLGITPVIHDRAAGN